MSLDVEVEGLRDHWYGGVLKKEGDKYAVPPNTALKLIKRGNAKKVGVTESERAEEPVELEPVEEAESEEEVEDDSSEEDED